MNNFKWKTFHDEVKKKYRAISPNSWWGDDMDVRFYLLRKLMTFKGKRILDIGCSVGITLSFLDKSNMLYGIDIDDITLEKAKRLNSNAIIIKASMDQLPFDNDFFDIVVMMNVFPYHEVPFEDKERIDTVFSEVYRVLKDSGIVFITTPNGNSVYYKGSRKITLRELEKVMNKYFSYTIKGWNTINIALSFFNKRKEIFHPKIFFRFESVWKYFEKNMDINIERAKYFYIEGKKK